MKICKPEQLVSSEWLWQYEDGERDINVFNAPEKTTLTFGIFFLDKLAKDLEFSLNNIYNKTEQAFKSWNTHYPWSEYNSVHLEFQETETGSKYLFGQLCVEDSAQEEESLIIAILRELSLELGVQVFIKVSDTACDFLLAEVHEAIPEEYQHPVANNRLWIHEGRFKLIPSTFYFDRGLKPNEALEFLRKAYFRCIEIEGISNGISDKMIKDFPNRYLSKLVKLPLVFENETHYKLLKENPLVINLLLKSLLTETIVIDKQDSQVKTYPIEFLATKDHCDILSLYLDNEDLKKEMEKIPLYSGRCITQVLNNLIENSTLLVEDNCQEEKNLIVENKFNHEELFIKYPFEQASILNKFIPEKDLEPTEELMQKLGEFFNEASTDKTAFKLDDDNLDISKEDSEPDVDDETKEYFKEQNADIDEDDFFEFFLQEALKLKKEDIESYRKFEHSNTVPSHDNITTTYTKEDMECLDELEQFTQEENTTQDDSDALNGLFDSLNVDGVPNGPLQTLLRNLSQKK